MTDTLQTLNDDIAFLKSLAEDGRSTPLFCGSILVAVGLVFGVASVVQWLVIIEGAGASLWAYAAIWTTALVVYSAVLFIILRYTGWVKSEAGANRAVNRVWQGVGQAIFTLMVAAGVIAWRTHSPIALEFLPSIVLALYGLAWMTAAAMTGKRWIALTALASHAMALLLALFSTSPQVMLLYALALAGVVLVPGIVLMRQARAAA